MNELNDIPPPVIDSPRPPRLAEPPTLHERILLVTVALTLAGVCWLISSGQGTEAGHIPWRSGSLLRAVTTLMAMNFEYPTPRGVEVKWLVQGLGAAVGLLVATTAWYVRRRGRDNFKAAPAADAPPADAPRGLRHRPPWDLAQLFLLGFTGWMILSAAWSPWPQAAVGEGVRQLIFVVWAVALGRTLGGRGVRQAAMILVVVLALTAAIGIWYYYERNPQQRLKFPIGNPIFMAACLLPGITLILWAGWAAIAHRVRSAAPVTAGPAWRLWLLVVGGAAALLVLLKALQLTDSRGPQLGLFIGLVVGAVLWLTGRARRGILLAVAVGLIVGIIYVQVAGPPGFITRRLSTVSFRQYAWSYSLSLFATQPIAGRGQTSYGLMAQAMANADAQNDPHAFAGELLGHAHNEWLEILADLGLVGFALMAAALGATFWCAAVSARRAGDIRDKGLAVGLAAALAALIAAEATDVGLRMPGLPVIFYTVVGLIWALARSTRPATPPGPCPRVIAWAGLLAGLAGSWAIATAAQNDWKGALADSAASTLIDRQQWDAALTQAARAESYRLSIEARLSAANYFNLAAYRGAIHRWQQMRDTLGRFEPGSRVPAGAVQLAREDSAAFDRYAGLCVESGLRLLNRIPGYPFIAERIAETYLLRQNIEFAERQIGLREQVRSFLEPARQWMRLEFDQTPMNAYVAMRLFQLSAERPTAERIDILRAVLRGGPRPVQPAVPGESVFSRGFGRDLFADFEPAIIALTQDPQYATHLSALAEQARAAASQPAAEWPDRYVPETLRLAARDRKLNRRFSEAVELADLAVRASEEITTPFPEAPAYALADRARYLLLADPEHPGRAVETCRQAIERWPAAGDRSLGLSLKRSYTFFLLASDNEAAARLQLAGLGEPITPEQMDRLVGLALGEVCQSVNGAFALDRQPSWLETRLQRSLALVPDWPATHWLAATLALARRDSAPALAHLKTVEDLIGGPGPIAEALKGLANDFPQDQALQEFVNQRLTTQPASTTAEAPEPEGPAGIPVIPFPTAPGEPASEPAVRSPQKPPATAPAGPPIARPGLPVPPTWGGGPSPERPLPPAPSPAPYGTSSDSGPKSPFIERPAATAPAR